MNENIIILTRYRNNVLFVLIENGRTTEYQLFTSETGDKTDNIYVCEVKDIVRNIDASFVNYGDGKTGFLKTTRYKRGTLLPLQLKREGSKDKAPLFTDELSLAGVYTVLTNKDRCFSISKKLSQTTRQKLRDDYNSFFSDLEYGVTLRTNSANANLKDVLMEADELAGMLDDIINNGNKRTVGSILFEQKDEWIKYCYRTDVSSLSKIITDDIDIYNILETDVINNIWQLNPEVEFKLYDDKLLPLDRLYSINTGLSQALSKKVCLKSGGFLYIETTEALTAIDVNTGKISSDKSREETFYECNLEATDEICRQIRLRGIGGIIIIDYINMSDAEHIRNVINKLKELTGKDPVRTEYHDVTALSLVELTRMKIRKPLKEQLLKAGYGEDNNG